MHIEVLVEDSSGKSLLAYVLPKLLGKPHTYNVHAHKGVGHIPKGLTGKVDIEKRVLLDSLPRVLRGYAKTPGIDAVVVILDVDKRDCVAFLAELKALAVQAGARDTLFRLAVEEIEAWYLGDRAAVLAAYPSAKRKVLKGYQQDSVCSTWERRAPRRGRGVQSQWRSSARGSEARVGRENWTAARRRTQSIHELQQASGRTD